jgi:misacylated tRNA(Ala) deacylase
MAELLYQTNSYLRSTIAIVTEISEEQHAIILDKTVFYPGGGGQPSDQGSLRWGDLILSVNRAKKFKADDVYHFIDQSQKLPAIGSIVECQIDWQKRYQLMRTHTAMHILCGVIFRDFGASVTGGDMDPLEGRMDFEFETMHKELVQTIEQSINQEVDNKRIVKVAILSREEAFQIPDLIRTKINLLPSDIQSVRVVEIVGLDIQADGGTHVHNTQEVGRIRVVDYKSKGRINKRIYIKLQDD